MTHWLISTSMMNGKSVACREKRIKMGILVVYTRNSWRIKSQIDKRHFDQDSKFKNNSTDYKRIDKENFKYCF